jgi:hypothetical protein
MRSARQLQVDSRFHDGSMSALPPFAGIVFAGRPRRNDFYPSELCHLAALNPEIGASAIHPEIRGQGAGAIPEASVIGSVRLSVRYGPSDPADSSASPGPRRRLGRMS